MPNPKQFSKVCKGCTIEKPREEYSVYQTGSKAGQLQSAYCKVCLNKRQGLKRNPEYQPRDYYRMTSELKKTQKSRYRKAKRERLQEYIMSVLKGNKCFDCPESRIVTLQFDHRDPKEKSFDVSEALKGSVSLDRLKAEVAKCDIVCANCHLVRTANMFGNWRLKQ